MKKLTLTLSAMAVLASLVGSPVAFAANHPPVWNQVSDKSVRQGETLSFTVSATDREGDSLSYSAVLLPSGAQFNNSTRRFSFTPSSNQLGDYPVTLRVTDGRSPHVHMSFEITVTSNSGSNNNNNSSNSAPQWNTISDKTTRQGETLSFTVSASDPDGDSLSYQAVLLPINATFNNSTRLFSFTPDSNQLGNYPVTLRVSDGDLSREMSFTVRVNSSGSSGSCNNVPTWNQINNQTAFVNQTLQFTVSAYDNCGSSISYSLINNPFNSSFNPSTRVFTFTPSQSHSGNSYTVTFRASNAYGNADLNVFVQVGNQNCSPYCGSNRPPVWNQIGQQTIQPGAVVQFGVSATDPDQDSLSYGAFNLPSGAAFSSNSRIFSWVPTQSQVGVHTVTFRAYDNQTSSDMFVTIVVGSGSGTQTGAPYFASFNPPTTAREGQLYSYSVQAVSPTGSAISYRLLSAPAGMSINGAAGTIIWVPGYDQGRSAPYLVTVAASSGSQEIQQSYYVTVQNVPLDGGSGAPAQPAALTISNIAVSRAGDDAIRITWTTNRQSTSRVIYDTVSQADTTANFTYGNATPDDATLTTSHSVTVNNLEDDTTYYFRVVSKVNGATKVSGERSFMLVATSTDGGASVGDTLGDFFSKPWVLPFIIIVIALFVIIGILRFRRSA